MAIIADLLAELRLDSTAFKAGLAGAATDVAGFSRSTTLGMLAVGAAIVAGMALAIHEVDSIISQQTSKISELAHSAARLGIGAPELEKLRFAANQAGVSAEQLNTQLKFMEKNLGNIGLGLAGNKVGKYFDDMGVSAKQLLALPIQDQFDAIIKGLGNITNQNERVAAATAIFGRGAISVLGLVKVGVKGAEDQFTSLGLGLSGKQIQSVEAYGRSVKLLSAVWEDFKNKLTVAVVPELLNIIKQIEASVKSMGGLGSVAHIVGTAIVDSIKVGVYAFNSMHNAIDLSIIKFEQLEIIMLRVQQISTLGLSNIVGTHSSDKIASAQADIASRTAAVNSRNNPTDIHLQIDAGSGLIAHVVNSNQNQTQIKTTINNTLNGVARGA